MRFLTLSISSFAGIRSMFASTKRHFTTLTLLCIAAASANAQGSTASGKNWEFLVEPYMMFPNMNGSTGVGVLPAVDVDADVSDIFSHLQFGAMLYFEAGKDRWAVSSEMGGTAFCTIWIHLAL